MPATVRRWTKELVQSLPNDGNRYELVAGELLVTPAPAPWHEIVQARIHLALIDYLRPLGLIDTLFSLPADISWTEDDLVQPDIFVVAPEDLSLDWRTYKHLRLVVEVLSPGSRRGDRVLKRRLYQDHGVETYWIADPDQRAVEVWHPSDAEGTTITDVLTWRVTPEAPGLRIPPDEIFRPVR